jgi:hypothetical protein
VSVEPAGLENPGFTVLGTVSPDALNTPRTLVVLGAPRGGTSAIAGILRELGIFLGDNASAPVFEDLELASRLEREGVEEASRIIEDYNTRHDVWGFKRPGLAFTINQHHKLFRNPIYLVVFRDLFAAANRNLISSHIKNPLTEKMLRIQASYMHILEFLRDQQPGMLACSYEKLLQNPTAYVDFLIEQAGLSVSDSQRAAAIRFVEPQPEPYLQHARADRCSGAIDAVIDGRVKGWARYTSRFIRKPVELQVFLDRDKIGECLADLPQHPGTSFDGDPEERCGFEFELPTRSGDELSVHASHEKYSLAKISLSNAAPGKPQSAWRRLLERFR